MPVAFANRSSVDKQGARNNRCFTVGNGQAFWTKFTGPVLSLPLSAGAQPTRLMKGVSDAPSAILYFRDRLFFLSIGTTMRCVHTTRAPARPRAIGSGQPNWWASPDSSCPWRPDRRRQKVYSELVARGRNAGCIPRYHWGLSAAWSLDGWRCAREQRSSGWLRRD